MKVNLYSSMWQFVFERFRTINLYSHGVFFHLFVVFLLVVCRLPLSHLYCALLYILWQFNTLYMFQHGPFSFVSLFYFFFVSTIAFAPHFRANYNRRIQLKRSNFTYKKWLPWRAREGNTKKEIRRRRKRVQNKVNWALTINNNKRIKHIYL